MLGAQILTIPFKLLYSMICGLSYICLVQIAAHKTVEIASISKWAAVNSSLRGVLSASNPPNKVS